MPGGDEAGRLPLGAPRRIIHIDMDAFYASVEQRDDPRLRGKPVAVGGSPESRGVVAASSYEAREFGVRSAMPMSRALRVCPTLLVVRPDFTKYRAVSQQVMAILRSCTALVEPLSLDEAYLDVTENYWREPLASTVAKALKARIREETGLTASAGVAPNKFLAKIASGWKKPDGLTVIAPERVEKFLQQLPVEALWGVGPVTAKKLRAVGVERLVDVRTADEEQLRRAVGSLAGWIARLSRGDDPRRVVPDRPWKSRSCETTYSEDLDDPGEIRREIERFARETAAMLIRKNLRARTVTIKVRYADFTTVTRNHTAEVPTCDEQEIVVRALALLDRTEAGRRPVRLLGVGAHGLVDLTDSIPPSELFPFSP
jgi:DNA polymerase-4